MSYNEAMVDLSIIILSYNTIRLTKKCIESVIASLKEDGHFSYEVIVLDNNSKDGSLEMLRALSNAIVADVKKNVSYKVIESKENLGFSKGNNIAVKSSTGKYLLFLNSDAEAVNNAIPKFLAWFDTSSYDIAGAKLLNTDHTIQKSVGRFYTIPIAFAALFLKADSWGFTRYSPSLVSTVDWVSGACLLAKRSVFDSISGFDEKIFMYWDEVDLQFRAKSNLFIVGFFPNASFIHHESGSSSSRQQPILKVYQGYLYFYKKHYSRLHLKILRYMLKLKAVVSVGIGKVTSNRYLVDTYTQAYEMAQMD